MAGSVDINVKSSVEQIQRTFSNASKAEFNKATARAINRVIASARTIAVREIKRRYKIDPKFLKERIGDAENRYNALKVWKANPGNLTATIKAYGKPIPIIAFPHGVTNKGVFVEIKDGNIKLIKSAFPSKMRSSHESIFARGKYAKGEFNFRKQRKVPYPLTDLPITQILTTSVRTAVAEPSVLTAMKIRVEQALPDRLEHEIAYLISKR